MKSATTNFLNVSPLIPARDVERSIAFYQNALGFDLTYRDADPAQFAIVGRDGVKLHLFANQDKHLADWTSLRIEIEGSIRYIDAVRRTDACIPTDHWARVHGERGNFQSLTLQGYASNS